jgi:hypothetical protein
LQLVNGVFRVRVVVPAPLREVIGKSTLVKTLGTQNYTTANRLAGPYITEFKSQLDDVKKRLRKYRIDKQYWITPPELYQTLDDEFHFDFDPCPFPRPDDYDSLQIDWGNVNYVNPPFRRADGVNGKGPTYFAHKAIAEHKKGRSSVLLIPTQPYVNLLLQAGAELRSMGRVRWLDTATGEPCTAPGPITCFILR